MRDRFNLAFPSLLLIGVAVVQIVRSHTHAQSPWKGGGFGMFASTDSPQARFVRVALTGPDKEYRVVLPPRLGEMVTLARTVPTEATVTDLAREALDFQWVREDYSPLEGAADVAPQPAASTLPGESPADPAAARVDAASLTYRALGRSEPKPPKELLLDLKKVRIEIWTMRLDATGQRMEAVMLRSVTIEP